jgi:hypothetical protein
VRSVRKGQIKVTRAVAQPTEVDTDVVVSAPGAAKGTVETPSAPLPTPIRVWYSFNSISVCVLIV